MTDEKLNVALSLVDDRPVGGRPIDISVALSNHSSVQAREIKVLPEQTNQLLLLPGKDMDFPEALDPGSEATQTFQVRTRSGMRYEPKVEVLTVDVRAQLGGKSFSDTERVTFTPVAPTIAFAWGGFLGAVLGLLVYLILRHLGELGTLVIDIWNLVTGASQIPRDDLIRNVVAIVGLVAVQLISGVVVAMALGSRTRGLPNVGVAVAGFRGAVTVGFFAPWFAVRALELLASFVSGTAPPA